MRVPPPAGLGGGGLADYRKRLARSDELGFRYLNPGPDGVDSVVRRRDEGARIVKALKAGTHLVALDERGDELTSVELATRFGRWRERRGRTRHARRV